MTESEKGNVHTVLIVDDDLNLLRFLEKRLASWGYEVTTAENGR
jgi:DNA-binding response OmpR family regulator